MRVTVIVTGEKLDLAEELREEFHDKAKGAVGGGADILLANVHRRLRARRGTRRTVAPEGEAPEFDTGELDRSFRRITPRVKGNVATSGIWSDHPGGNRQEFGFVDARGIRTLAHPYLRPAVQESEAPIEAHMEQAFA